MAGEDAKKKPGAKAKEKADTFKSWALEQVNDLTVLEINTIVKPDITARPIGSLADAILDVVDDYTVQVERLKGGALEVDRTVVNDTRLTMLATEATALLDDTTRTLSSVDRMILKRLRGNCAELAGVLHRTARKTHTPTFSVSRGAIQDAEKVLAKASPMDQSRVRKIRDIGTEVVIAQSRIHLDGDVITRISPDCLEGARGEAMLAVHREGVDRSVRFWNHLAELGLKVLKQIWDVGRDLTGPPKP